ncbi:MAG: tail fiber domain-containing protein [Cytophagaceae bacterium]|nr:tail fiber domain-containing protein [Cytophagaceae bacterium]
MKTGNTPGVRLEQDNSSGFTAQTWDVAGNEANFFVRDITNGSKLPFRIRPNAPTSSIDIASTGNVGIGTSTPTVKLQVEGNGYFLGNLYAKEAILPGASSPSDRKLKKNIEDFTGAGSIIKQLSPKTYYYNTEKFPDVGLPSSMAVWFDSSGGRTCIAQSGGQQYASIGINFQNCKLYRIDTGFSKSRAGATNRNRSFKA